MSTSSDDAPPKARTASTTDDVIFKAARQAIEAAGGLMGVREAAQELGIQVPNLSGAYPPAGLPAPVGHPASGRVWLADEIRTFAKERKERTRPS